MAGTTGRPPYTGVGQGVRWQGGELGFFGGFGGDAVSVLSSAARSSVGGVSCGAHPGARQDSGRRGDQLQCRRYGHKRSKLGIRGCYRSGLLG